MSYTQKYIESFGKKVTPKQLKYIKSTLRYQRCVLADAIEELKTDIKNIFYSLLKADACNHIIGIARPPFKEEKSIYHSDFIKSKKRWSGELFWRCPLCNKRIWVWVTKKDREGYKYKTRRYIGHGKRIDI